MFPTDAPYAVYFDKAGAPLDNGYIYFGVENQNPETSPLQVFWDMAGTQPVAQPVRTIGGFPVRAGSIADVYANAAYSQTVRDSKGNLVRYAPSSTAQNPFGGTGTFALVNTTTTNNDFGSYQFRRNVEYSGGTPGFVNSCVRIDSFVDNAGATAFEWALTTVMHNNATAGENVAAYMQGIKNNTGATWGADIELIDNSGANPTTGAVSLEIDMNGNGTDNNNSRVCLDIALRRVGGIGALVEAGYGIRFQNSFDTQTKLKTAIGFYPGMSVGIGLDFSAATVQGPSVNLAQGQAIQFNSTAIAANSRLQYYNGGGYIFANTAGTTYWSLNDDGSLVVKGIQLLGARQTGFVAMTGTPDKGSTLNTATVTLAQLAGRVMSIQAAMTAHGQIGA